MSRRISRMSLTAIVTSCFAMIAAPIDSRAQSPELGRGQTVRGTIAPGDTLRYGFEADDDFWVYGEIDQISADVFARVLSPDGNQVARSSGPGRGSERFASTLENAGIYTVEIIGSAEDEGAAGDFTVTLRQLEPVREDPRRRVDQLMARWDGEYPGAAVRVWQNGRTLYSKAFGSANLTYGIPFAPETRTNIGSTSKQFTSFAIMLQAERGELSLDDDIREHIPELPEFDEIVTVRHLLTHTSGLREFLNLLVMTGRRLDRGDWIDRSEIIDVVQRQPALQNAPGAEWNYNNTAFGLAALIVERTSGQDFHDYMRDNVFVPLGMTRTMVRPSPRHIVPEMSEGYTPGDDGYLQIGDLGGAVGAGSMYSSIGDLQTWIENYANPRVGTRETIDEMMTSYVLTDGEETGYGYGLFVDEQRGLRRIHHGGADVAHRSMLAYYPEINAGVTTQSNNASFNSNLAFEIAEAFFEEHMEPDEGDAVAGGEFDASSFDPEDFDDFVGHYQLRPDFILTFSREDETLYAQATGQPRLEIVPTSDSTFRLLAVEATVTFRRAEDGTVESVTLDQGGQTQEAARLEEDAEAVRFDPTAEDLEDFAGRYFSDEVEAFYELSVEDGTLVSYQRRLGDAELEPGEQKDTFSGGNLTYSFERDRNGKVIGFYLSNVRTRDVRFARVP